MSQCDVEFLNFCQLMLDVGQFRTTREFSTGSRVEVRGNELSLTEFSNDDSMDVDVMVSYRDEYVFSARDDVPSDYRSCIFRYVTDGIHPGFVHLLKEGDGTVVVHPYNGVSCRYERNGPALTFNQRLFARKQFNLTEEEAYNEYIDKKDYTYAHHSPYWPREAVDWITRQQPQGSLSHNVIRRVVGYGCNFVCVSHKGYIERNKEHEWRFSFSMAELILIKNWSRQQRTVYRTIRVLHKMSLDTGRVSRLCTYHYKTLMLWAVETKSQCFWNDLVLRDSVRAVLMDMIRCLKIKSLYHYFIPTNNLFDHLLCENLSHDVNVLLCTCEDIDLISRVLEYCMIEEFCASSEKGFVTMPPLLYTSLKVSARLNNKYDDFTNLFCLLKRDSTQKNFSEVLRITYGLIGESCLQQKDQSLYPVAENYSGFHLFSENKSKNYSNDENLNHIFKCSRLFDDKLMNFYGKFKMNDKESLKQYCESADAAMMTTKVSAASKQMKYQLYSRCAVWMLAHRSLMNAVNVDHQESVTRIVTDDKCLETLTIMNCFFSPVTYVVIYYAYWPGYTPTVPISWFINKAYTVNHYYTLFADYKTAAEMCDKIINAYNVSIGNQEFAEYGFPVLLSTQWIEMYDRELQQILGLASLCKFVIHGSDNRSVHLPACPVLFAIYLKFRCVIDTGVTSAEDLQIFADEYNQHADGSCRVLNCFTYGKAALSGVLLMILIAVKASVH